MENQPKRLYLSKTEKVLAGVCGGLAEYFEVDPIIIRVIFIALALFHGIGILIYIILLLVLPRTGEEKKTADASAAPPPAPEVKSDEKLLKNNGHNLVAGFLIIVGLLLLFERIIPGFICRWDLFWPVVLIAAGLVLLLK